MPNMSQEEMTKAALHRKDLSWWRRMLLLYLGGSWLAAIIFLLIGLPANAFIISVGLSPIISLLFFIPLIIKTIKIFLLRL